MSPSVSFITLHRYFRDGKMWHRDPDRGEVESPFPKVEGDQVPTASGGWTILTEEDKETLRKQHDDAAKLAEESLDRFRNAVWEPV